MMEAAQGPFRISALYRGSSSVCGERVGAAWGLHSQIAELSLVFLSNSILLMVPHLFLSFPNASPFISLDVSLSS